MQIDFSFPQYKQPGSEDAGTECDTLEFDLKVRCSLSAMSLLISVQSCQCHFTIEYAHRKVLILG